MSPRQTSAFNDRVARQSLIARAMGVVWSVSAMMSLAVLIGSVVSTSLRSDTIQVPDIVPGATMTNPRFTGNDDRRGAYVLRADSAVARADDVIDLTAPVLEDSQGRLVIADTGVYHRGQNLLVLEGRVSYFQQDGNDPLFVCRTVRMHLRTRQITGNDVAVSTSGAQVTADSFYSEGDYQLVRLFGSVRTVINQPLPLASGDRN